MHQNLTKHKICKYSLIVDTVHEYHLRSNREQFDTMPLAITYIKSLIALILLQICVFTLYGQNTITINDKIENFADITPNISLYADTNKLLGIDDIANPHFQDNFIPFETFQMLDDANVVYWGKLNIENETNKL